MAAITLGWKSIEVEVLLVRGQDWIVVLEPEDEDGPSPFPDGTTVVVDIYPPGTTRLPLEEWPDPDATWEAEVGDDVQWKIESALADEIVTRSVVRIMVSFPNSPTTDDYRWAKGVVRRDD